MSQVKERASRYRNLMKDETFKEVIQDVRSKQVGVFLYSNATIEEILEAHQIVKALDKMDEYMKSAIDDEVMYDKKHS
tara:strand:+ start:2043 stop:2276 length:234 start_codon:yes stop_codon:yes gene_type:complete